MGYKTSLDPNWVIAVASVLALVGGAAGWVLRWVLETLKELREAIGGLQVTQSDHNARIENLEGKRLN